MEISVLISDDLATAIDIRRKVFIEEQKVPEELEIDEYDYDGVTQHVLALDQDGRAVGTARFRPYGEGKLKIERVAVLAQSRGCDIGSKMMSFIEAEALKNGYLALKLEAQVHARSFYERRGFLGHGAIFLDAGIEHITMEKQLFG
ncbi:MAG: yjcF [Firmicutes bacterium]|nr:yjcF [Bacillota bacterium]